MKLLLSAIASALGLNVSAAPEKEPGIRTVDPHTIYFSIATLNDALPPVDTGSKPGKDDLVIHEDDWRQFEAVSGDLQDATQREIAGVLDIHKNKSKDSGGHRLFTDVYVRKSLATPFPEPISWSALLAACGVEESSVSGLVLQGQPGLVRGGFSIHIGGTRVYGVKDGDKIRALCFDSGSNPGLNEAAADRLAAFFEKSTLVLVHWPSATIITRKDKMAAFFARPKN